MAQNTNGDQNLERYSSIQLLMTVYSTTGWNASAAWSQKTTYFSYDLVKTNAIFIIEIKMKIKNKINK